MKKIIPKYLFKHRYKKAISESSVEKRFSNIYKNGLWFGNQESKSGSGSMMSNTKEVRKELPRLLEKYGCNLLVDVGCGDFNWMRSIDLPCKYIGIDIVKSVIDENNEAYANDNISFKYVNAIEDPIPECDAFLCKDVLFHLSYSDGKKLISNLKKTKAKYLFTTTNTTLKENKNIRTGNFREINLHLPPYNLPDCIDTIANNDVVEGRIVGVWDLDKITI